MVFEYRLDKLNNIRKNPKSLPALRKFYQENIAQFIIDWGCTSDPRNVEVGLPTVIPFLLFPKQEEWVNWVIEMWKMRENGVCPKSREIGFTWSAAAISSSLCMLHPGMNIGFGSRKSEYVDKIGEPKTVFHKIREFTTLVPNEFKQGWSANDRFCSKEMLLSFPATKSTISGEAGDNIGRGARCSIYFVDESAFIERPQLVDAALSQTTNCRIDISTPCGPNNSFAHKFNTYDPKFVKIIRWQDDPRKDQEWYEKQKRKLNDPVIIAQELDLDFNASVEGVLIPNDWIMAAIDAHIKLCIEPKGIRKLAFDVADEGRDKNADCGRYGVLVEHLDEWSGKGGDIYKSTEHVFRLCDEFGYDTVDYDADGLGASVRGDARKINEFRKLKIEFNPFRGSGEVVDPDGDPFKNYSEKVKREKGRTNEDYFANRKAQGWFALRQRFLTTYRAVMTAKQVDGVWTTDGTFDFHTDDIISIPNGLTHREKLIRELGQPTCIQNNAGKMLIDKRPDGTLSPNLADAVMIAFAPAKRLPGGFFGVKKVQG